MKNLILFPFAFLILAGCTQSAKQPKVAVRDGFYEVMALGTDNSSFSDLKAGQVLIPFDTLFNPGDATRVAIDTNDYVPLELDSLPRVTQQPEFKKLLSVSLTPGAAEKMKAFTAKRVMKSVAVVLDGKAITEHKIREAITGNQMQITRCGDNACEYLFVKMKDNVTH